MWVTVGVLACALAVVAAILSTVRARRRRQALRSAVAAFRMDSDACGVSFARTGKAVLVVVNPYGGARQARRMLRDVVAPMCKSAGVKLEVVETTHAGHAADIGRGIPHGKYAAIVVMSGDTLLHELVNGMARREVQPRDAPSVAGASTTGVPAGLQDIPLTILPVGTSNGTATSLTSRDVFDATASFLEGSQQRIHAMKVSKLRPDGSVDEAAAPVWDLHVFSWAIVAQHDHLAERQVRWMGKTLKQLYCPAHVILQRKLHTGRATLRPVPGPTPEGYTDPSKLPLVQAGSSWRLLDGNDFIFFSASGLAWASHDACFGPGLPYNGPAIDLLVMRGSSRMQLLSVFLAMENGTHIRKPCVERYLVTAFTLEPAAGGVEFDISGQNYPSTPVRVDVVPDAVPMWFKPGTGAK